MHEDEEIRAILDGTGYFDIRGNTVMRGIFPARGRFFWRPWMADGLPVSYILDLQDRWVRIKVEAGDLIVLVGDHSRMD